jgi:hypothetical protein
MPLWDENLPNNFNLSRWLRRGILRCLPGSRFLRSKVRDSAF